MTPGHVSTRAATDEDRAFLFRLFATTRERELAFLPLPPAAKEVFLRQQFDAQTRDYASRYASAEHAIVTHHDAPIGRVLIHRGHDELRLVDIALLPEYRRQGIGTRLVGVLIAEGREKKLPVRLSVLTTSEAMRLYERLGFLSAAENDAESVYRTMECPV
ncbi:Acetyltransferase, GNAT family [Labilithrix luteola]|uniref:Acetyltransferase, GNAT family n=1 Tax=Labilithrix luteola TaxID=1391654 RepID=A0A0K1QD84_9BACT|nr:GNAT family N-acetyltransferase [Labilithrix luteola]AKV03632.1 Acetyltransferase, GNAT family [Labilithrix luteola]